MKDKKVVILLISSILLLIVFIYQGAFAYFQSEVLNTGSRNTSIATKNLKDLQIIDGTTTSSNIMIPGESVTQTFQVKNENDMKLCFKLNWTNVVNTFVNTNDLRVSLSDGTNNIPLTLNTFPTTNATLASNLKINASTTNNYTLTVEYLSTQEDQTADMGKKFSGSLVGEITECSGPEGTLKMLSKLNSNYTYTENSSSCLTLSEDGSINNPYSTTENPIICTMEDDYGTSYYLRGNHQDNNVKFANMCWKLVRVTGTGGLKLIYNGDLDENGKCTTTTGEHMGYEGQSLYLSGNKVYGTSYTKEGSTYTLTDTSTMNFSTDSASIIGKYTCGNTNTSCTTLYAVTGEYSSTQGYALTMGSSIDYSLIGETAYSYYQGSLNDINSVSLALAGYMYNDTYPNKNKDLYSNTNNYYYGESFTYTGGTYTLNNTVQFADVSDSTNKASLNTHHYTCFNAINNTCTKMYYIYYLDGTSINYIELNGNETGEDALNKMIVNNDINVKNSHIKGAIDWWYEHNLKNTEYESKLEDTIFCNDRTIDGLGGWSDTGDITTTAAVKFHPYSDKYYLKCPNKRDAFTVNDVEFGNGALKYPISTITMTEDVLTGNQNALHAGGPIWTLSPSYYGGYYSSIELYVRGLNSNAGYYDYYPRYIYGIRPSISLIPGLSFKEGTDGTASNPFEISEE